MRSKSLESLANTRKHLKKLYSIACDSPRFFRQTRNKHFSAGEDVFLGDTFDTQRFIHDLQIRHTRYAHLAQSPGCPEDLLEHRNGIFLVRAHSHGMNQRAIDVPKQYAH